MKIIFSILAICLCVPLMLSSGCGTTSNKTPSISPTVVTGNTEEERAIRKKIDSLRKDAETGSFDAQARIARIYEEDQSSTARL